MLGVENQKVLAELSESTGDDVIRVEAPFSESWGEQSRNIVRETGRGQAGRQKWPDKVQARGTRSKSGDQTEDEADKCKARSSNYRIFQTLSCHFFSIVVLNLRYFQILNFPLIFLSCLNLFSFH